MEAVKYHITKLLAAELNEWNINSESRQIAAVLPFDRKIIFNQFIEEYPSYWKSLGKEGAKHLLSLHFFAGNCNDEKRISEFLDLSFRM
ncbi:hypothetical protein CDAR_570831 [Caerostris darwini]|uniref:Uncharacterized protein n=1 Tax=Caerostris darwini TaxID=1538125 RepID=A0AAV4QG78_9ARAC|nr:hypothetical protein CDAR_570831 [Caerostris darwini]